MHTTEISERQLEQPLVSVKGTLKCQQCRKSKKKCEVLKCVEGASPFPQQRCQRCVDYNLDCSERKIAKSKEHYPPDLEVVQKIDTVMSVFRLILTTRLYIFRDAKRLECGQKNCSQKLDDALAPLGEFLDFLDLEKMRMLQSCEPQLYEPNMDILYGYPVSGTLSKDSLNRVSSTITSLQQAGRHGTAYFVKLHHLHHFPRQFEKEDRSLLEKLATNFVDLLRRYNDPIWREHGAPEPFWTSFIRSPLLPHECLLVGYTATMRNHSNDALTQTNFASSENRQDCLGRSVSHIYNDYGAEINWRVEADLHQEDILGRTALHYACREGNHTLVKELIKAGADMYKPVVTGMSPLHFAARGGHTPVCESLWESRIRGKFPNGVRSSHGSAPPTPVMCAADAGKPDTVNYFCKNILGPADLQQLSSLLISSVQKKHVVIVEVLLDYKEHYDIAERDKYGHDALWYAQNLKNTPPEIETALIKAMGAVGLSKRTGMEHGSYPDVNVDTWLSSLYSAVSKKKAQLKTHSLFMEIDETILSHLLLLDSFPQALRHKELVRVRTMAKGTKMEQQLYHIDKAIVWRLRFLPAEFVEPLSIQDLEMVRGIEQVISNKYALDSVLNAINCAIEKFQRQRQHIHAASDSLSVVPNYSRKRRRPNGGDGNLARSPSQPDNIGPYSTSKLPN